MRNLKSSFCFVLATIAVNVATSMASLASTISCSENVERSMAVNFYMNDKSGQVTINYPVKTQSGYAVKQYIEMFATLDITYVKNDVMYATDENGDVNLSAKFNSNTKKYDGQLSLSTSDNRFLYMNLEVACTIIN